VRCDVQDWAAQQALVQETLEEWGRLDVVFANAGVAGGGAFVAGDATPEAWRAMVLTNIFGVAATARLTLPALIERRGRLLLMGSVVGRVAIPGSFYSATKWALTGMSESIRAELIGTGVRVTVLEAGFVDTPMLARRPDGPLLAADDVARTVMWVLEQPPHVDINEVLIRPVGQAR
jgi:NADP-dependent 3-hydroxy acid dehydrogenase YdfG